MASRRGHGDGSIYERIVGGKLQYVGMVSLGRVNGKRIRKAVHGASKAEVRAKLKEIQRNADAGLDVGQTTQTVGDWLTKWLEQLEAGQKRRSATLRRYGSLVRVHLIPGIGHHHLDKLSRVHVDDLLAAKLHELQPQTVKHLRAVLRTALNRAVRDGLVLRNAAALTDPVEVPRRPRHSLSVDEARALLHAAQGERLEALYVLAINVGLRIGEALALRWQDVNHDAARLSVVYNLQRVRGKLDPCVEPKTEQSRRTVSLPPAVVQALQDHGARQRKREVAPPPSMATVGPHLHVTDRITTRPLGRVTRLPRVPSPQGFAKGPLPRSAPLGPLDHGGPGRPTSRTHADRRPYEDCNHHGNLR
jgi:integrase